MAGQLIADYTTANPTGSPTTSYLTTDHLGSTRVVTDQNQAVKARRDYLPFGEEIGSNIGGRNAVTGYTASDSTRQRFTGHERDIESGLDFMQARYYSANQGRFTSPDSFEIVVAAEGDAELLSFLSIPQAWNKYAYTYNNPLRYVDPDGQRPQEGAAIRQDQDIKAFLSGKMSKEEYLDRIAARGAGAAVGVAAVGAVYAGPIVARVGGSFLLWLARNPEKAAAIVESLVVASTGNPAPGPPGTLTISATTRLKPAEIQTGLQAAKQLGVGLAESPHVGEEFYYVMKGGVRKTIDACGQPKAFQHWNPKQFFNSIKEHVNKSADYIALDLRTATKIQVNDIKQYVSTLTQKQQDKIIYIE